MEVGIRDLRASLSKYVDAAKAGQEVIITERGKPVARLTGTVFSPKIQDLIDRGIVIPAMRPRRPLSEHKLIKVKGSVSDIVIEQRRR